MRNLLSNRRRFLGGLIGAGTLLALDDQWIAPQTAAAQIDPKDSLKITKLETFVLKNSWVFVKLSTNAGIVGWGEMLKDKCKTCAAGAKQQIFVMEQLKCHTFLA